MDSKLSAAQADMHAAQADMHHDGGVVALAPKHWMDAEEALTRLAHVAADRRHPVSDFAAEPRAAGPSRDGTLRPPELNHDPSLIDRPSRGARASRGLARFLVTACVGVAATLAWQSYGGSAKEMIASSAPQLSWLLLSPPDTNPQSDREIAVELPSVPAVPAPATQSTSAQTGAVASIAPETVVSGAPTVPPDGWREIETIAHDLAALRQSVEQLAAGQEQLTRDVAKLETAEQDIRRRLSAAPPPAAAARKPVPPLQPTLQSSTAPVPTPPQPAPQPSVTPLPPAAPEPPSRPPMPIR
jgi:hypothetical protein